MEQRLARQAHNLEVVGSIPTGATSFNAPANVAGAFLLGAHMSRADDTTQAELVSRPHDAVADLVDLDHLLALDGLPGFIGQGADDLSCRDFDDVAR